MSLFIRDLRPTTRKFLANIGSAGGSISNSTIRLVDSLIVRPLEYSGLISQIIKLNVCVGNNLASSSVPIIDSTNLGNDLLVNMISSDYSQNTGWNRSSVDKYVDTGYIPTSNNQGFGIYARVFPDGGYIAGSTTSDFGNQVFITQYTPTDFYAGVGGNGSSSIHLTSTTIQPGLISIERTSSDFECAYRNGVSIGSYSSFTSSYLTGSTLTLFTANANGDVSSQVTPISTTIAGYYISTGLSDIDLLKLYSSIQNFNASIGRNV